MSTTKSGRPVVFIGSSTEGLPIAEAIQLNLDYVADVVIWSQGVFGLSEGTLESLVDRLEGFDFAILVLTPDDVAVSRGRETQVARDNVLFELGLFIGHLGRKRCFMVYDRSSAIELPSDLGGVTPATYHPHTSGNLQSALGAPSTQIKLAIAELGQKPNSTAADYVDSKTQFRVIADLLDPQYRQAFILMHESGVAMRREEMLFGPRYEYWNTNGSMGSGFLSINQMCKELADAGLLAQDLRGIVSLTERGHAFADWLVNSGYKIPYFWCDLGSWGERPEELKGAPHPSSGPRSIIEMLQQQPSGQAVHLGRTIQVGIQTPDKNTAPTSSPNIENQGASPAPSV